MKILFAASEIHPLLKTGGLADVAGALPLALRQQGADVRLIMPAYRGIVEKLPPAQRTTNLGNPFDVGDLILLETHLPATNTPIFLVQCQSLFEREGGPYLDSFGNDYWDNHIRFAAFSWVCATLAQYGNLYGWQPDILHLNDWQTGFAAAYLKSWKLRHPAIVTTVHNLRYNGSFPLDSFAQTRLSGDVLNLHGMEFYGRYSALKAALCFADAITTVSPTYAQEILTSEYGDGLDSTLRPRQDRLHGILNGVDYDEWSPEKDAHIEQHYNLETLDKKQQNKLALLRESDLPEDLNAPLFAVVSRMTEQKGLDLIPGAMQHALAQGAKLVVLGSGDKWLEQDYLNLAAQYPNQVAVRIGYDESYSHRIQAGADVFMIPSRFEPCGLTQLYALKYGTLPLVRRTGGLADTVFEGGSDANGFTFEHANGADLSYAIARCLTLWGDQDAWQQRQRNGMGQDHSWQSKTGAWLQLYRSLMPR
ncbi:glycogen synthase GlgA [Maribrevibacterium harenarium]|uniref:Glycogen synthase n=1 Tax=Maribrevibacterium harenarium TaxID=2589817 RepID=A0A501WXH5_9GAMM|nr:glycogen synthase GlgA [Maribrevibacterium harenarium]TPE52864.1 glycogen synthase GlgA [Maribrevibacterium harenarium]